MLPYHTVFVLQQERLSRYQGAAARRSRPRLFASLSRAASRALNNMTGRSELRPAI